MKPHPYPSRSLSAVAGPLALAAALLAAPAALAAQEIADSEIRQRIMSEIRNDIPLEDDAVYAEVNNGTVRLSGSVDNYAEKTRIRRIASNTMGVDQVFVDIDLDQSAMSDIELRSNVDAAIEADSAVDDYEVDVRVDEGVVTIHGNVQTVYEARLAEDVVSNVYGVVDVINSIDVDRDYTPEEDLYTRLGTVIGDELPYFEENPVDYDAIDGNVSFYGSVDTMAQRDRLAELAYGVGALDVDVTELEVNTSATAGNAVIADADNVRYSADALEVKVERRLMRDPRTSAWRIDVNVDDGIAQLSGTVDNLKAKRRATQIARQTVGIWDVQNAIEVRTASVSGEDLAIAVENALERDPFVTDQQIEAEVDEAGTVTLYGEVPTIFEKGQAEDVVSRLEGVTFVYNELTVEDPTRTMSYDPGVDVEWSPYDYEWGADMAYGGALSDAEIREQIQDELWWNPMIDAEEVDIQVEDGIVTLSGEVDNWVARSIARENAYEGGARRVDNDLAVIGGFDTYAD